MLSSTVLRLRINPWHRVVVRNKHGPSNMQDAPPTAQDDLMLKFNVAAKEGNWRTAIVLIRQLRQQEVHQRSLYHPDFDEKESALYPSSSSVSMSARHWVLAMTACARAPVRDGGPRWRESLGLLDEMRREGFVPTTAVFNAAMDSLGRARRWQVAKGQGRGNHTPAHAF